MFLSSAPCFSHRDDVFGSISRIDPSSWVAEQTTFSISKALLLKMKQDDSVFLQWSGEFVLGFNLEVI